MNVQDLVDWCNANGVSLTTSIALRAKDDHLLMEEGVTHEVAYFGNCEAGRVWEEAHGPRDADGELDYENMPKVIILDSFSD